jgi:hypothetical protein
VNKIIEKAFEAVLIAQKKLNDATSDADMKIAEAELKMAQENLITLEARLELLNNLGAANGLPSLQYSVLSDEAIEKFIELLLK